MSLCHILLTGVSPQVPNTSGRTTCIDVPDGEGGLEGRFCIKADAARIKQLKTVATAVFWRQSKGSSSIYNSINACGGQFRVQVAAPKNIADGEQGNEPEASEGHQAEEESLAPEEESHDQDEESLAQAEDDASGVYLS